MGPAPIMLDNHREQVCEITETTHFLLHFWKYQLASKTLTKVWCRHDNSMSTIALPIFFNSRAKNHINTSSKAYIAWSDIM
jgi:hypothetical protein